MVNNDPRKGPLVKRAIWKELAPILRAITGKKATDPPQNTPHKRAAFES